MLSNREKEVLEALKVLGLKWIVRDGDDRLIATNNTNVYKVLEDKYWTSDDEEIRVGDVTNIELFQMVKWEDDNPTSIEKLLTGKVKSNPTKDDIMCAKAFIMNGYNYIARDEGGSLYLYLEKPFKEECAWTTYDDFYAKLNENLFLFVDWEDDEPTDLKKLIENNK